MHCKGGQFCNLVIAVTGTQLAASATVKPQVCQVSPNGTPSPYFCYQSSAANAMIFTLLPISTAHAMLTISTDFLALSVYNTTLNAALTLQPRTFTITSNGPAAARNIAVSEITSLPTDTTLSGDCSTYTGGNQLASSGTCRVTVNPGSTSTVPSGSTPDPSVLLIAGENTTALTPEVEVLTYGNIYQQGYIFAFDNTTLDSVSVGGALATLSEYLSGTAWGNPNITTNAVSKTNGESNTETIIAAQGDSLSYASSICAAYQIDSSGNTPCSTGVCYDNWFLPSQCQVVNEIQAFCFGTQGMVNTLSASIVGVQQAYWTSTEVSTSQAAVITVNGPTSFSVPADKTTGYNFRCTRLF